MTSYGGLRGYGGPDGGGRRGGFGPPPPGGGMPYQPVETYDGPGGAGGLLPRPRRRSNVAVWRRAAAAVVDTLLMAIPVAAVWWAAASYLRPSSCEQLVGFEGEQVLLDCNPLVLVLCWVLVVATIVAVVWLVTVRPWSQGRTTFGGGRFKLAVIDAGSGETRPVPWCVLRFFVRTFISPILGIGFFWMIWDPEDRTLEDLLTRTAVVTS